MVGGRYITAWPRLLVLVRGVIYPKSNMAGCSSHPDTRPNEVISPFVRVTCTSNEAAARKLAKGFKLSL